ncbi:uncharacterized protein TNCT_263351 [Trichonephila clavata]|uniref:Uncharacterized protein n=1 Tax=Trichonephila clavata TaxID=2740835 RepID=A0A8X6H410_TRICU|nr:uncharacterized protein TNCT_263351 [Trichonephila clavata]
MIVFALIKNTEPWTNIDDWRHVPEDVNPADLQTPFSDWSDLLQSPWWEGPTWLRTTENIWPNSDNTMPDEALVERKKSITYSTNINLEENFSKKLLYFSKYSKLIRIVT